MDLFTQIKMTPLKRRSFSESVIANQSKYNLEYCNKITNAAGRRVWGFFGIEAVARPNINGFSDVSERTYVRTGGMAMNFLDVVPCTYVRSVSPQVELENIHEQTLAGRQQKARNGLWNGAQAPFGYSLRDKKLIIYPKEAETVKEIFRLYTEEGQSLSYIAKKLNDENIQREQRGNVKISGFTDRTVRIILSNPVYAGMISYGRRHTVKVEGKNNETKVVKQDDESKIILVDGVHEPIVSKETFAKAAERLKKNVAHRKTRSDSTTVYPLTSLIRCPDCGKNIFGYTAPPRKKKNGKEGFYNMDTNSVELTDNDGSVLTIDCEEVENHYDVTNGQMADLDWLLYNAPMEYASLVLSGELEKYLNGTALHGIED